MYVPKTAAFTGNRRIYVSWLPDGGWAGNAVFRELVQHEDGTLGTKFVPEMMPKCGDALSLEFKADSPGVRFDGKTVHMNAANGAASGTFENMPAEFLLTAQINPEPGASRFGVVLHADGSKKTGCELLFDLPKKQVSLHAKNGDPGKTGETNCAIDQVEGLDRPFSLEVVVKGDIMDVCIDHRRTLIARYRGAGSGIDLLDESGNVTINPLEVRSFLR